MKKKPEKSKWAKWVNRDDAKELGRIIGMRRTLEMLAEEDAFSPDVIVWLIEEFINCKDKFKEK